MLAKKEIHSYLNVAAVAAAGLLNVVYTEVHLYLNVAAVNAAGLLNVGLD